MVDTNAIRGLMAEKRITGRALSKQLGISEKTFWNHMKRGIFGSDIIEKLIQILGIKDPVRVFFAKNVT